MMYQDFEREMYLNCVPKEKQTEAAYREFYGDNVPSDMLDNKNDVSSLTDADISRIADAMIARLGTQTQAPQKQEPDAIKQEPEPIVPLEVMAEEITPINEEE